MSAHLRERQNKTAFTLPFLKAPKLEPSGSLCLGQIITRPTKPTKSASTERKLSAQIRQSVGETRTLSACP